MHRTRALLTAATLTGLLAAGAATIPAQAATRPADCCSIPTSETPRPVSPSPTQTFGIPGGEIFRTCRPTIGHPCH